MGFIIPKIRTGVTPKMKLGFIFSKWNMDYNTEKKKKGSLFEGSYFQHFLESPIFEITNLRMNELQIKEP